MELSLIALTSVFSSAVVLFLIRLVFAFSTGRDVVASWTIGGKTFVISHDANNDGVIKDPVRVAYDPSAAAATEKHGDADAQGAGADGGGSAEAGAEASR